jgi:hypothetical protein
MPHYVTVHNEPGVPREIIESRWKVLAQEARAVWVRTWFNLDIGKRFCWWDAPNKEILEAVFNDHAVPWERITQVQLTTPSEWAWRED